MKRERHIAFAELALIVGVAVVGFVFLRRIARQLEAHAAAGLLHLFGAGRIGSVFGADIPVLPGHGIPFIAVVTASCSSLGAVFALIGLGAITPPGPLGRKTLAIGAATATVVAGNILRIAASLAVGLLAGQSSLVLFHDWVGGLFTFAYILGGYALMLFLLLPRSAPEPDHVASG